VEHLDRSARRRKRNGGRETETPIREIEGGAWQGRILARQRNDGSDKLRALIKAAQWTADQSRFGRAARDGSRPRNRGAGGFIIRHQVPGGAGRWFVSGSPDGSVVSVAWGGRWEEAALGESQTKIRPNRNWPNVHGANARSRQRRGRQRSRATACNRNGGCLSTRKSGPIGSGKGACRGVAGPAGRAIALTAAPVHSTSSLDATRTRSASRQATFRVVAVASRPARVSACTPASGRHAEIDDQRSERSCWR